MVLENITYEDLLSCGTILKSPFASSSKKYLYPILFDGNVYKFFNGNSKKIDRKSVV